MPRKEECMINMDMMDRKQRAFIKISISQMRIIFLSIFSKITHLIMMMTMIFLAVFLEKKKVIEAKKELDLVEEVLEVLVWVQAYLGLSLYFNTMMIFSKEALEVALEVKVIFPHLNPLHSEVTADLTVIQDLLNQWVQQQKQCNLLIKFRNGKTVTSKKTTIVNQDGSK